MSAFSQKKKTSLTWMNPFQSLLLPVTDKALTYKLVLAQI